ncbi:NAD-P-binding protein [Stereum hirsutum FP-91666 SS1]|uniref:NAD-P-binding protein n=1 Tax=Stereum hirsutum (strain FP-91666) TaxID=721885 RepID=R7RX36_STEHR|nr:NAD-P-binding protein [Stereum hirsutum FP-91666 SS1]EIM79904.1 NAD-P-binding protein [Stereum hirsutum FP-91666 SS1]
MSSPSRVALITGASRKDGLGYTVARQLSLQHNFTVLLGSRFLSPSLDEAFKQLETDGAKHGVFPLQIDVASAESVQKAAKEVEERFGRLDVLVNNAAVGISSARTEHLREYPKLPLRPTEHTRNDFDEVFAVNVYGVVDTINAFAPLLVKSPSPRIVNVTSVAGSLNYASTIPPDDLRAGFMVYSASKAALKMLTIMYSKDLPKLNPAFKINSGSPGFTKTAFNNYLGTRTPDEGAAVMTWLATLPDDGPNSGFYADHPPYSTENGKFREVEW